jgi:thioredoxin-related protein
MPRFLAAVLTLTLLALAPATRADDGWKRFFSPSKGDMQAELAQARKAGKQGLFVMYQFEACPHCARMKRDILSREDVRQAYQRRFASIRFASIQVDTLGTRPMRGFDGRTLAEKDFAKSLGIHGGPIFVFYALDGEPLLTYRAPLYDAPSFIALGEYVASGAYRDTPFPVYVRNHRKTG